MICPNYQEIRYSSTILPACLPQPNDYNFRGGTVQGWGNDGYTNPNLPSEVDLLTISNRACEGNGEWGEITENMFCATQVRKGFCYGDSGGPLIINERTIVGVVSWVQGCNVNYNYNSVFATITNKLRWIRRYLKDDTCTNNFHLFFDQTGPKPNRISEITLQHKKSPPYTLFRHLRRGT